MNQNLLKIHFIHILLNFMYLKVSWFRNGFLGSSIFLQKTNENKSTWGNIVVKLNSFVRFLEETLAWKNHFDFVWPLVVSHSWVILKKNVRKSTWGTLYIQFSISKSHKAHFENNVLHDLSWHNLEVLSADFKADFSVKISWKYFQIVTSEDCAKYCLMDFSKSAFKSNLRMEF